MAGGSLINFASALCSMIFYFHLVLIFFCLFELKKLFRMTGGRGFRDGRSRASGIINALIEKCRATFPLQRLCSCGTGMKMVMGLGMGCVGDPLRFEGNAHCLPLPFGISLCALGRASCCIVLCHVRDLCHTKCKYMSKHAKHFTDHDIPHTHTTTCIYFYTHI